MCEKLRATRQCSSIKDIFAPIHSQALSAVASSTHAVLIEKYVLDAINGNKKSVSERKD
jgi:hypothetical protein